MNCQIRAFIVIILLSVLSACSDHGPTVELDRAEALMDEHPDSALTVLRHIDSRQIADPKRRARYALLISRALDKNDINLTDDSIVSIATAYYDAHGDEASRAAAHYYKGRIMENARNYGSAIVEFLIGEKSAVSAGDRFMLGLIYRGIADCYDSIFDKSTALDYYKKSYEEFSVSGRPRYAYFALYDLGVAYYWIEDYERALDIFSEVKRISEENNEALLSLDATLMIGDCYFHMKDYTIALEYYKNVEDEYPQLLDEKDLRNIGETYLALGSRDSAKYYDDRIKMLDQTADWLTFQILRSEGDYSRAIDILEQHYLSQTSFFTKVIKNNVATSVSDYFNLNRAEMEREAAHANKIKIIVFVASLIVIVLLTVIYRSRLKLYRSEAESNILVAQNLRNSIADLENRVEEVVAEKNSRDNEVREMLTARFDLVDRLCGVYYEFSGTPREKTKIYDNVIAEIRAMGDDCEVIAGLEKLVDRSMNNLMADFRRDNPSLKDWEYQLFLFLVLRFSARAISIFQRANIGAIYTRKNSLKRKITKDCRSLPDRYLAYFA